MPPRFDSADHTIDLAVADLLDAQLLRSIGFAGRGGYERMWLGQAIHSRYQERALEDDPTYRREVAVKHTPSTTAPGRVTSAAAVGQRWGSGGAAVGSGGASRPGRPPRSAPPPPRQYHRRLRGFR